MNNKFNILSALILLFNTIPNSYSSGNDNKQLLNINNYSAEINNNNIEIQQNNSIDSDNEDDNSSINSNTSRNNNMLTLFKNNRNKTIRFLKKALKQYKNNDEIDKIKELTNTKIAELKNIKLDIDDNVFSVMNRYIEILLNLKNELYNSFRKTQRKLYVNLFKSIDNCIDISKNNLIKMALLPSREMAMSAPYNSSSYLIAFHEYDNNFNINCNENNGLSFFDDDCDEDLVSVSKITKPIPTEVFKSTHDYVTSELEYNIINNSHYKYLDELKSKVHNVLDQFNKIYNESLLNNNIIDRYTQYSNVVNNLYSSLGQYIQISEISGTINDIIKIVNDREKYIKW